MPRDSTPRMLEILSASPETGMTVPGPREHALHARMRIGRAADDLHDVVARIDHAKLELVGVGMFVRRDDMGDNEILQRRALVFDRFHFEPDARHRVGDRLARRRRSRDAPSARRA